MKSLILASITSIIWKKSWAIYQKRKSNNCFFPEFK